MTLDRKIKWLFGLVVLACVVIVLEVALGTFEPVPPKPLPNPNGYDDFVKAGKMLIGEAGHYSTMKQDELAALVATNTEALKLLRIGLNRECGVPNDYSTKYLSERVPDLLSQQELAFNLCAEGALAKMQNRTNDAAHSYLDAVRFGLQCSQGGTMFLKRSGISCESLGRKGLQSLSNDINASKCHGVVQTLEIVDAKESPLSEFLEQERLWMHKVTSIRGKIDALIHFKEELQQKAHSVGIFQTNQLQRRQMMIDFAARAYELEKGKPPTAVTALVPDYLKAIPKDPVTGSNLVLRTSAP